MRRLALGLLGTVAALLCSACVSTTGASPEDTRRLRTLPRQRALPRNRAWPRHQSVRPVIERAVCKQENQKGKLSAFRESPIPGATECV